FGRWFESSRAHHREATKSARDRCSSRQSHAYWHTVPGVRNTRRVSRLACTTLIGGLPSASEYANVALSPSRNVSVRVPTGVLTTLSGSNGTALNGGPVVLKSAPL